MANMDKFDLIANQYDTPGRIHIARLSSDAIREYAAGSDGKSAIDFGCGTGLVGLNLIDAFGSMLFLDSSPNMIEQVRHKIAELRIPNAETLCFDFEEDVLYGLRADYIFMAQVLLHIPDIESVLSRLHNVLNEDGHLLIVDFDKNEKVVSELVHNGFDQEQLAAILTKIGYRDIRSRTFYQGTRIFMGQDATMFVLDARKVL